MYNKFKTKLQCNSILFTFFISIYFAFILNIPFLLKIFKILNELEIVSIGFIISIPIFLICALTLFFTLFSIKHFEKIFYVFLILASSIISYSMYNYGVIFDNNMFDNIVKTNHNEIFSYVNKSIIYWFVIFGILPSILVYQTTIVHCSSLKDFLRKIVVVLISSLIIATILIVYYKDYSSIKRNYGHPQKMIMPIYPIYSMCKYIYKTYFTNLPIYKHLGLDAKNIAKHKDNKNFLLIFLIGETARSMNYQLNGYNKDTNKYTKGLNVISFKNVTSCGTNTATSVPCMFSEFSRNNYSAIQAENQDNLLDILKNAKTNVLWIENNAGCYNVCKNINTINLGFSFDEKLTADLQTHLDEFKGTDSVIFLHANGSHGPSYYKRFPKEYDVFKPGCLRNDIQNCTREELINTYDNSILYTDFVLSKIIKLLQKNSAHWHTSVIYASDHGESLGEKGLYLHGFPYNIAPVEQTHIPYITWFSKSFIKEKKINTTCLKNNANNKEYSHDNIFSSVLGLMDIKTDEYDKSLDMFYECRK